MVELYSQVLKDDYNTVCSDWKVTGISILKTEALNETEVICHTQVNFQLQIISVIMCITRSLKEILFNDIKIVVFICWLADFYDIW